MFANRTKKFDSLERKSEIISNKAFQRLAEKTQVVYPKNGREETVQNRLTHSYQVENSAKMIAESIRIPGIEIDPNYALDNVCLLHDIGHPPFGHEGAKLLNSYIKSKGVQEGFDDNNNNFVVIEKNQIPLSDYELASLIKYPDKLYPYQKEKYLKLLELAIDFDIRFFEKEIKVYEKPKRTLICEIMDEADTNTYISFDLADCFSLGLANEDSFVELLESNIFYDYNIKEALILIINAIRTKNKSLIKRAFNRINILLNNNYVLSDNLSLKPRNPELIELRRKMYQIEINIFIKSSFVQKQKEENLKMFKEYIEWIEQGNYPSKTYSKKIAAAQDPIIKHRLIRDMIAETTDWYVFNTIKNRINKLIKNMINETKEWHTVNTVKAKTEKGEI